MKTSNMIRIALVGIALCLPATASAEALKCYVSVGQDHDDGTTNKGGGGMYNLPILRALVHALLQELDDTEQQLTRKHEQFARLLGPCLMPDGTMFTYEP